MKYALAVTAEPFKFSSRHGGAAYELSKVKDGKSICQPRTEVKALFTDPNWLLSHLSFPYSKPGFWRGAVNTKKNTDG